MGKRERAVKLTLKTARNLVQREFGLSGAALKKEAAKSDVDIYAMDLGRFSVTISNDWFNKNGLFKISISSHTGAVINIYYDPVTLEEDFDAYDKELEEIRKDYCFSSCEFARKRYRDE